MRFLFSGFTIMHCRRVLACVEPGWCSAATLSGMGDICRRLVLCHLEIESSGIGRINNIFRRGKDAIRLRIPRNEVRI